MLLSVGVWCKPRAFLKALNEIAFAGKAASVGDLGNGHIVLCEQQIGGTQDPQVIVKLLQRLIGDPVKIGVDLGNADVESGGDLIGGQRFIEMLNQILNHVKNVIVWRVETVGRLVG